MTQSQARFGSKLSLIVAIASVLVACAPSSNSAVEGASVDSGRLQIKNETLVIDTTGVQSSAAVQSFSVSAATVASTLTSVTPGLKLIGTIAPPTVGGTTVAASDVVVSGTKAYVAYNTAGPAVGGALDIIDFTILGVPVLKSSVPFADTDINKVFVDQASKKVYLAGATSAGDGGAILYRYGLDITGSLGTAREVKSLRSAADPTVPAYAATSVIKSGNYVYALSGSNGGLTMLNAADLSDRAFTSIGDARDLGLGVNNNLLVVSGKTVTEDAKVRSFSSATGVYLPADVDNVSLAGASIDEGKSSIFSGPYGYLATAGTGGAKAVCHDGYTLGTMLPPTVAGLDSSLTTANAVTFGDGIVYIAQGAAGVALYSVEKSSNAANCAGYALVYRGRFSFGPNFSVNNVYFSNGYLVIATGLGGFQIVQVIPSLLAALLQMI